MTRLRLTFLTPLFSKGSYEDRPEIRPPSIRGQLHWWFRALGGSAQEENAIFGSVHSKPVIAGKIVVRVASVSGEIGEVNTLPHKHGGQASPKWAFKAGTSFDLILSERLGGLTDSQRKAFRRTLEAWLLAGTLGLRSTRAAGSFTWQTTSDDSFAMPGTAADYAARLADVFKGAPLHVSLLEPSFHSAEAARTIVSDTLGGRHDGEGENDLARLNHPLGRIFDRRKTSPLRFRIVQFGQAFHIVAVWDNRTAVTGNQPGDYDAVIRLLWDRNKEIGSALAKPVGQTNR